MMPLERRICVDNTISAFDMVHKSAFGGYIADSLIMLPKPIVDLLENYGVSTDGRAVSLFLMSFPNAAVTLGMEREQILIAARQMEAMLHWSLPENDRRKSDRL